MTFWEEYQITSELRIAVKTRRALQNITRVDVIRLSGNDNLIADEMWSRRGETVHKSVQLAGIGIREPKLVL